MEMYYSPFATHHSPLSSLDLPRLFRQHDRNAVADRVGELGGARDQFLPGRIEFERALGHRTDQDFQQLWIDGAVEAFGRGAHLLSPDRRGPYHKGTRGVMALTSAPVRRPRPVVASSATADPIAQSRETPNREFGRGHGQFPPTIRTAPEGPPHSSTAADRSPARRCGPRD